ncbi:hypothetical protein EDC04DRAFT_2878686 [Pisolithus marmoratus]|nr:hypothetical protein EDC04DRAFT_2878686 [Pisolithus marmoratus]
MVLDGMELLDVSHAGGEFQELTRGLLGDFWKSTSQEVRAKRLDYHMFWDRSTKHTAAFKAYMAWPLDQGGVGGKGFFDSDVQHTWEEQQRRCDGVDAKLLSVLALDVFCAEKASISIGPTDCYLTSALICHGLIPCSPITPKVAVMVHALDLYHTAHQCCPHLSIQAYVKTLCDIHRALQCDQPDWHLKYCCPACTYKLQDELAMNDSLKRVVTRVLDGDLNDTGSLTTSLPMSEYTFHHEQYLMHEFVETFASGQQAVHSIFDEDSDGNLCAECWKNMKDSTTQKMWNVFDESGAFIAVCQHDFCLLMVDMVQSSEQSKYALTVTSKLLDTFGSDLGGGYDIGCQFKTTLASSALGEHARSLNYTSLINAFHGHAHNRLCQLDNLTTYVKGLGLEDLEGCEHAFSKSNALAPSTRYVLIFHRRQAIACYFEHNDEMEVYANLTRFLLNNYKQALDLLSNGHATLEWLMCELGVSDPTTFKLWLDEEHVYLKSLLCEPVEETLQMEYWQWLVSLEGSRKSLETILSTWSVVTTHNVASIQSDGSTTRKAETMCHHAQENYKKDLKAVQELEGHLGITHCWVLEDEEWQAAACLVANQKYQQVLDNIEHLVVSQIFKLSKMNPHIGKALQTCSAAICAALSQDTRQDASTHPWALPTTHLAINMYFKLCRAEEEVVHLNVEIYEDCYIQACEALYQDTHPALTHQISRYHAICSQFTPMHLHYLQKISCLPGFSGSIVPGISMSCGLGDSAIHTDDGGEDADEPNADEDHGATLEEQCEALQHILSITMDM